MRALIGAVLAAICVEATAVGAKTDTVQDLTQAWAQPGPVSWLTTLSERPDAVFYVARAPEGWVREADLALLAASLDSTAPAATVCFVASAHAVPASVQSTVGREAAILLDAFRHGLHYPGACSDLAVVDVADVRRWWASRRK